MSSTRQKKTRTRAIITDRDKRLFLYLFVNKVATINDIKKDIFHNKTAKKNVYRRLIKLSKAKIITSSIEQGNLRRRLYSLTMEGFKKYISKEKVARRIQLKSDSIEYDLTLL